ncbi:MAG: 4Fe-4S dicluster domain-containing protein [Candidatus Hodarchaeales archaeon]
MAKRLRVAHLGRCVGCYQCVLACSRINERVLSIDRSSIRIRTAGGYQGSLAMIAIICRGCMDPPCVPVCPVEGAIRAREKGGGVRIDREVCDSHLCNHECVSACPIPGAIHIDDELNVAIVCRQCGWCVKFCPTGVLEMTEPKPGF